MGEIRWWLMETGPWLVWARLVRFEDGHCEVLDSEGETFHYDSEDAACESLLHNGFRAIDGFDEDDAREFGFTLDDLMPPAGDSDDEVLPNMIQRRGGHA